jgi:hypothetical protein
MVLLLRIVVILALLAIVGSLFSALFFMMKDHGKENSTRMVKALTFRIGLSIALFIFLSAGFYFGFLPPMGLRAAP